MYSRIFNTEFNIFFFIPKKIYVLIVSYKNPDNIEKVFLDEEYQFHIIVKNLSREEKENNKILEVNEKISY